MIIPAIIPHSLPELKELLADLSFADIVQIDVVDGLFVQDISWPYEPKGNISELSETIKNTNVEVDLMVQEPLLAAKDWLKAGASALVFHIESLNNPSEIKLLKQTFSFELGFSLNNDTSLEELYPYIEQADFVQLMGIKEIGAQAQEFDLRVLERIATLRSLYPNLIISIDGSVNEETLPQLKKEGADRFAVGSAILTSPDKQAAYAQLLKIASL